MYYNQAILWQGQGKTMQIVGKFLRHSFFSNSSSLSYIAGSKIIQQGRSSTKHEADMMCNMNQVK